MLRDTGHTIAEDRAWVDSADADSMEEDVVEDREETEEREEAN